MSGPIRSKTKTGTSVPWWWGSGVEGWSTALRLRCAVVAAAALLIGLHRLRPANSEHQWAETDWASWVTKSQSPSSLICQEEKKSISHSPGKCFPRGKFEILGVEWNPKNTGGIVWHLESLEGYERDSLMLWFESPFYHLSTHCFPVLGYVPFALSISQRALQNRLNEVMFRIILTFPSLWTILLFWIT